MAIPVKFVGLVQAVALAVSVAVVAVVAVAPAGAQPKNGSAPSPEEPSSTANADIGKKNAKKLFRKGQRYFAMGKFRQALESYEKAYELTDLPEILFNMAQCYRNLGDYETAVFHFRTYLDRKPDADNRDAVVTLIERLEKDIAEADRRRDRQRVKPKPPPPRKDRDKTLPPKPKVPVKTTSSPFYKRWWFWAGLVVVAGGTTGYLLFGPGGGLPDSDLGNIDFPP